MVSLSGVERWQKLHSKYGRSGRRIRVLYDSTNLQVSLFNFSIFITKSSLIYFVNDSSSLSDVLLPFDFKIDISPYIFFVIWMYNWGCPYIDCGIVNKSMQRRWSTTILDNQLNDFDFVVCMYSSWL